MNGPTSRRPLLNRRVMLKGAASVGAAVAIGMIAPQVAQAATRSIRLRPNDLAPDPSSALQGAVDSLSAAGGGTVQLPVGVFALSNPLSLKDGVTVAGAGIGQTVIRDAEALGAQPILVVLGTEDQPVRDVGLRDLTVRNGTATTDRAPAQQLVTGLSTVGKDGMYAEYAQGITLSRVEITEIQGLYGWWAKATTRVTVQHSRFYRCTYAMLSIQVDCESFRIQDSTFDTTVSTAYPQNYTLHMGGDTLHQGTRWARDVTVVGNHFLNNRGWEGIDCHGGEDLTFVNNRVENCYVGIMVGNVLNYVESPVLQHVRIQGNVFDQGAANQYPAGTIRQHTGVVVAGAAGVARARDIQVIGNTITGFGGQNRLYGSILVERAQDVLVRGNRIRDFGNYGVVLGSSVFDITIEGNDIGNMVTYAPGLQDATAAIGVASPTGGSVFGAVVRGNRVGADSPAARPQWFIYDPSEFASWQVPPGNDTGGVAEAALYYQPEYLPVDRDSEPTDDLVQRRGDLIYTSAGRVGWTVVAPTAGFGSLDTTTVVVAVDTVAGSSAATIVPGGVTDYTALPPGMNVVIEGAGPAGSDLTARVVDIDGTTGIILDRSAGTSTTSAALRYQPLTLQAASRR